MPDNLPLRDEEKAQEIEDVSNEIEEAAGNKPQYTGIAICGSHPQTIGEAPFDDPRWLIYACSPHNIEMRSLPRIDEWFEIHIPIQDATRSYHYLRMLEHLGHPVWYRLPMIDPQDPNFELQRQNTAWFKEGRPYPEEAMKKRFGPWFFTSSIAFMMAKALVDCEQMNIKRIGLWGIMQASENEYTYQRPGIQYFIQRATEMGIQVVAPEASRLFEPPPEMF